MEIELKKIYKSYEKRKSKIEVIKEFSYKFEPNNMYLIKGESGTGKTTLMSLIGLLDYPDSGEILFNKKRVDNLKEKELCNIRKNDISFLFQDYNLLEKMTVYENIKIVFEENKEKEVEKRINDVLDLLKLSHRKNHLASELSGGEKQRVTLARAIVKEHSILICDEPISNLDESNAKTIIEILKQSKKDKLVIVSCHTDDFDNICDKRIDL